MEFLQHQAKFEAAVGHRNLKLLSPRRNKAIAFIERPTDGGIGAIRWCLRFSGSRILRDTQPVLRSSNV